jgi:hypothetical protein
MDDVTAGGGNTLPVNLFIELMSALFVNMPNIAGILFPASY